ncbi:2966_t:CDS:2, partial [Scutellospora calospora]
RIIDRDWLGTALGVTAGLTSQWFSALLRQASCEQRHRNDNEEIARLRDCQFPLGGLGRLRNFLVSEFVYQGDLHSLFSEFMPTLSYPI